MAPPKKAPGRAVDKRNGHRDTGFAVVAGQRFDPPENLCAEALDAWDAYWADRVAQVQTPVDRAVLLRWVTEMDRYLRLMAAADLEPVVRGSQGQPVENPMYGTAYKALAAVQACEKQMGMGALNRSALGIAVITESKSLRELNTTYGGGSDDQRPALAVVDPRTIEA